MNAHYLWLAESLERLTFFAIAPAVAIAIAYRAGREDGLSSDPKLYGARCVVWGVTAFPLFVFAKWIVADAATTVDFLLLHFGCALLSLLSFGVFVGYGSAVLLHAWRWHKRTRLT